MHTLTIRNVPSAIASRLRLAASKSNLSLNKTVVTMLGKALGLEPQEGGANAVRRDIGSVFHRWTPEEAGQFDSALKALGTIDEEMWK